MYSSTSGSYDRVLWPAVVVSSIVAVDGGDIVSTTARWLQVSHPGHVLDPGPFGTLGTGAPFAIAAKIAQAGRVGATAVRMARAGAKKRPFYHIVVTDSRNRRDGRYIERLGFFNPIAAGPEVELQLDRERVDYWLSQGARASERVAALIKQSKKQQSEGGQTAAA